MSEPENYKTYTLRDKLKALFQLYIIAIIVGLALSAVIGLVLMVIFTFMVFFSSQFRSRKLSKEEILHAKQNERNQELLRPYQKTLAILFVLIVYLNLGIFVLTHNQAILYLVYLGMALGFLVFIGIINRHTQKNDTDATAKKMGFTFSTTGDPQSLHEKLRTIGKKPKMTQVFSGAVDGIPVRIFNYQYEWLSGKASYDATILETAIQGAHPNMLIISKEDSFGNTIAPVQIFPGTTAILEGNFSDHFLVYVAEGAEDDVRQILTPDLMLALIDEMSDLSFMIFDNRVYVVLANNTEIGFLKDNFVAQVGKVKTILTKWLPVLSRMD